MQEKEISQAVIRRMPRYYRYLGELLEDGVERISSNDLSKRMNVTASQIRQDLNNFGGFGQQGYGYNVKFLYDEIGKILGVDKKHPMAGPQPPTLHPEPVNNFPAHGQPSPHWQYQSIPGDCFSAHRNNG